MDNIGLLKRISFLTLKTLIYFFFRNFSFLYGTVLSMMTSLIFLFEIFYLLILRNSLETESKPKCQSLSRAYFIAFIIIIFLLFFPSEVYFPLPVRTTIQFLTIRRNQTMHTFDFFKVILPNNEGCV